MKKLGCPCKGVVQLGDEIDEANKSKRKKKMKEKKDAREKNGMMDESDLQDYLKEAIQDARCERARIAIP